VKYAGAVVASAFAGLFGILVASRGCLHGASSRSAEAREDEARARWPSLPRDEQAASVLIARRKLRAEAEVPDAELQSEALMKRAPGPGWGSAVVGVEATQAWIQGFLDRATARGRDAYVLFGTFHDAAGQVDAFRRLVGPGGLRGLTSVTAEQFRATGAWSDVDERAQRGDDDEIAAYVERGDRDAFATLGRRHRESDYAAWKLAYEPSVLELLVTGRAIFDGGLGARFRGCDMPTDTQRLALTRVSEQTLRRLREIHCLAALDEATRDRPEKRRVAMLWGQAHVQTLRQLLPGSAEVLSLYVFGFRSGEETTEASLAKHLAIEAPLLLPLDDRGDVAALLYPDPVLGGVVDRVQDRKPIELDDRARRLVVSVSSDAGGHVLVGDRSVALAAACPPPAWCGASVAIEVPTGNHPYVVDVAGLRFIGSAHVPEHGALELRFDARTRRVESIERGGAR